MAPVDSTAAAGARSNILEEVSETEDTKNCDVTALESSGPSMMHRRVFVMSKRSEIRFAKKWGESRFVARVRKRKRERKRD